MDVNRKTLCSFKPCSLGRPMHREPLSGELCQEHGLYGSDSEYICASVERAFPLISSCKILNDPSIPKHKSKE